MGVESWSTTAGSNTAVGGISIAEGMDPSSVNDADREIMAEVAKVIGTSDFGTLTTGVVTPVVITKTASGNPAGTTDWRATVDVANYTGANGAAQVNQRNTQHNLNHTAGTISAAVAWQGYSALGVPSTPTTTGNVSTIRGIEYHISHTGTGSLVDAFTFYGPGPDLDVGTGLVTNFANFRSGDISGGSGSNRISGEAYGFKQANSSIVTTPIMAGYGSEMSWDATGKRWGIYFTGGANNSIAGRLRIGDNAVPTEFLEVAGNITFKPAASATPAANGVMTWELTSNTQLKIKVKGSDGVVRSTTLTLA